MKLDHAVIWVEDPLRSLAFFESVVGLEPVRKEAYVAKKVPFPSVRISDDCILDLIPRSFAARVKTIPGVGDSAGHPTNHLCLAMTAAEFESLTARLVANGTPPQHPVTDSFGARGTAPRAFYFADLDGNILEARYYDD